MFFINFNSFNFVIYQNNINFEFENKNKRNMVTILLLIVLCHIVDDFCIQNICLSQMKCKSWWVKECEKLGADFKNYKDDYLIALCMHATSWAIMILLPVIFMLNVPDVTIIVLFTANMIIHAVVDNLKANMGKINLLTDQIIHLWQIIITFYIVVYHPNLFVTLFN